MSPPTARFFPSGLPGADRAPVPPLRPGDSDAPSDEFSFRSPVRPRMLRLSPNLSFGLFYTLPLSYRPYLCQHNKTTETDGAVL